MSEALKPVRCGCGGEAVLETDHDTIQPVAPIDWKRVKCNKCNIRTTWRKSEAEAITAWNRAMGATDKNVGDKERKKGEWVDGNGKDTFIHCSVCDKEAYWDTDYGQQEFDFCPYCGADMRGE